MRFGEDDGACDAGRLFVGVSEGMEEPTNDSQAVALAGIDAIGFQSGRIEQQGAPLELYHHPANLFVAGFLGAPSMMALGALLVLATGSEGAHRLRAFDTRNGQLVWQAPLTSPRSISLLGGALVIEGYAGVTVRRASDGVEIARWP